MPETNARALSTQRKRRGVVKASITRLSSRLKEFESKVEEPTTQDHAQRLATKLETLDAEFKTHHFSLIDLIDDDDDETLEKGQETLDQHDDDVTTLAVRIQTTARYSPGPEPAILDWYGHCGVNKVGGGSGGMLPQGNFSN